MARTGAQWLGRLQDTSRWLASGRRWRLLGLVLLALVSCLAAPASAALTLRTETGLHVTIHTAEEVVSRWVVIKNGRTWLQHPTAGEVELETERFPWLQLVPVAADEIAAALAAMRGFETDLQVEVFLLPGFPVEAKASFARRQVIFMAPGLAVQAAETIAFVATHEMGHVLCWAALDQRPDRWQAYRSLRGLPPQTGDLAQIPHAQRHREIIAEDMRFLFGGDLATRSGTIENQDLPLPNRVPGLAALLVDYLGDLAWSQVMAETPSQVYPNPCRDQVRVELMVADQSGKQLGQDTVLEIFDVRGRLVRRLEGCGPANGRVMAAWDGQTAAGLRAADGQYLYRIRGAGHEGTGRFLVISR